jgi:hypothetical protein
MAKSSSFNKKAQDSDPIEEFTTDENEFQNHVQAVVDSIGGLRGQTLNLGTSLEIAQRETNASLNKTKNKADQIAAAMKTKAGPSSLAEAMQSSKRVSLISITSIRSLTNVTLMLSECRAAPAANRKPLHSQQASALLSRLSCSLLVEPSWM